MAVAEAMTVAESVTVTESVAVAESVAVTMAEAIEEGHMAVTKEEGLMAVAMVEVAIEVFHGAKQVMQKARRQVERGNTVREPDGIGNRGAAVADMVGIVGQRARG